jgi:hypothetical protein
LRSVALAILRPAVRPTRLVFLTLLASVVLALALLLFVGASTGSAPAAQWLLLTGGDGTGAVLAMIASGAILVYALLGTTDERQAIWRWAPGIVDSPPLSAWCCGALTLHEAHLVTEQPAPSPRMPAGR